MARPSTAMPQNQLYNFYNQSKLRTAIGALITSPSSIPQPMFRGSQNIAYLP